MKTKLILCKKYKLFQAIQYLIWIGLLEAIANNIVSRHYANQIAVVVDDGQSVDFIIQKYLGSNADFIIGCNFSQVFAHKDISAVSLQNNVVQFGSRRIDARAVQHFIEIRLADDADQFLELYDRYVMDLMRVENIIYFVERI